MYACAIPIMVSLPGRFFPHYYQLWLPLLAVGFGGAVIELRKIVKPFWIPQLIATSLIVTLLYLQLPYYQLSSAEWVRQKYGDYGNFFIIAKELSQEIDKLLQADETFYEWGYQTGLYYYNQRHPPTGVFSNYALSGGPLAQKLSQRVIADLKRHQPEILILSYEDKILADKPLVLEWLFSNYTWIPLETKTKDASKYFSVLVRHGGNLESRLRK
jgi:hypothetical protein